MKEIPLNIQKKFFKVWLEKKFLPEFEKWIYDTTELKTIFSSDYYYKIISFNYKTDNAHSELRKLIETQLSVGENEKWKVKEDLLKGKNRINDYSRSIINFYYLYCKGYDFMESIAFNYSLVLETNFNYEINQNGKLTMQRKQILIDACYPGILVEIEKILSWIENEEIILIGKNNNFGRLKYIDNRIDDKKEIVHQKKIIKKIKWFQFWK